MSRTTLRPCLKHSTDLDPPAPTNSPLPFALCSSVLGPRVHFPPTPVLCQTHLTHSAASYDRAPIVVLPNACALPERNGRTYTPSNDESARKRRSTHATSQGATLHPQAFTTSPAAPSSSPKTSVLDPAGRLPSLVPDLSSCSESDESDVSSTPPVSTHFPSMGYHHHRHHHHHAPISIVVDGTADPATALAFLPHANEREKPRSRSKTRGTRTVRKSEFAVELDGCLGGF
jgi:hypothetical protein